MKIGFKHPIIRLFYSSRVSSSAIADPTLIDPQVIGAHASGKNAEKGITGCLVCVDNQFVQVLEGALSNVESTFEQICRDMRHIDLRLLDIAGSAERTFPEWTMACLTPRGPGDAERQRELRSVATDASLNAAKAIAAMRAILDGEKPAIAASAFDTVVPIR
jgi:hypothetical protein